MQAAVAIPVGVLSGICVLMFVFMLWWFPRHYQKGIRMDMAEHDANRREMEAAHAESGMATPPPVYTADGKPLPPRGYQPSAVPF